MTTDEDKTEFPKTIVLDEPIQVTKDILRTEIVFKNRFQIWMAKSLPADTAFLTVGHFFPLIEAMTGEPSAVISKLGSADFQKCAEVVRAFL